MRYDILQFGAVGDGVTNDTAAIQQAVDRCAAEGGGTVVIPGGYIFRCGMLRLCSNLELHLEMGAVLKASDRIEDHLLDASCGEMSRTSHAASYDNCDYTGKPRHFFLYAKDCQDIAITGQGHIHGNDEIYYGEVTPWHIEGIFYPRTPMIFMENCCRVTLTGVTLERSAFWTVHLVGCRDVLIDGIRIYNDLRMANCDGIDPDHCRNVRISNCHIECADDCIVFKNTEGAVEYGSCENITVSNCTLVTSSAAVKFGSESHGLFRNILVENCVISRSSRGVSMQLRDGGSIENVMFRNLTIATQLFHPRMFWGKAEPIAVTVLPRTAETTTGTVRDVYFDHILCQGEGGLLLYAHEPGQISDIFFRDVRLSLERVTDYPLGHHDLRPGIAPAETRQGMSYVHMEGVRNARFQGLTCRSELDVPVEQVYTSRCEEISYAD